MVWIYNNRTGKIYLNGEYIATGYSGKGIGLNNPGFEFKTDVGPIPAGWYRIGVPHDKENNKHVLDLTPINHSSLGRSGFQIHGDNTAGNNTASKGCIILKRHIREMIANSGYNVLYVIGAIKTTV